VYSPLEHQPVQWAIVVIALLPAVMIAFFVLVAL
jgi:hypothetical protein